MRQKRILARDAWYEVRTKINNNEPLFRLWQAAVIFFRVFRETRGRFAFEIRGFHLEDGWLSFYIRPEDGFQLPRIIQWMKQTFAVRFNGYAGRTGHIWGDRYWSRVLAGEPPEWAEEADRGEVEAVSEMRRPAARKRRRGRGACGTLRSSYEEMRDLTHFETPLEACKEHFCDKSQKCLVSGAKPHKLRGVCPPGAGKTAKSRFSPKNPFHSAQSPG